MSRVDRLLWIPLQDVRAARLREMLTVRTSPHRGQPQIIEPFERQGEYIGVPRAWGLNQKWLSKGVVDACTLPYREWPQFVGKYRTGQAESVRAILRAFKDDGKYGALLEAPTGTGKTVMATAIASQLHTPTLVVVHKEDLAEQWQRLLIGGTIDGKRVEPMFPDGKVGHVQGDKWQYEGCHLVTAMQQTLYSRIGREPEGFYEQFGLVITDEAHHTPATTFERVMRLSKARYRLGVSATFRRRDSTECLWHWHIGQIEHRTKGVQLIGQYIQIPWKTRLNDYMFRRGPDISYAKYLTAIAENPPYNKWLAEEILKGAAAGRKILLCSHRVSQLEDLRKRLLQSGKPITVGYYAGKVDGKTIKRDELDAAKKCQVILGTYKKVGEGTDIPTLDTLYLATPGSDVEQVVGRIQRPVEKRPLLIIDPVFQTSYNKALAAKRVRVYEKLGFRKQGD